MMNVFSIIYIVSGSILLAVYLYRRKESTFNWKKLDSIEKFAFMLVILFAPIIILFLPYFLFTNIMDKILDYLEKNLIEEGDIDF